MPPMTSRRPGARAMAMSCSQSRSPAPEAGAGAPSARRRRRARKESVSGPRHALSRTILIGKCPCGQDRMPLREGRMPLWKESSEGCAWLCGTPGGCLGHLSAWSRRVPPARPEALRAPSPWKTLCAACLLRPSWPWPLSLWVPGPPLGPVAPASPRPTSSESHQGGIPPLPLSPFSALLVPPREGSCSLSSLRAHLSTPGPRPGPPPLLLFAPLATTPIAAPSDLAACGAV